MEERRYVYLLKNTNNEYKIGVSKNVERRVKQLQTGCTDKIIIVDKFLSNYPFKLEKNLHRRNNIGNISGEWFYLDSNAVNNFQTDCELLESNFDCLEKSGNPFI